MLSAIGIAGMDRLVRFNVLATSGRSVEAAGDVDTLLLDKTGTSTLDNRQATEFLPVRGVTELDLAEAARLASLADDTPEGPSIVVLAKERHGLRGMEIGELKARFVPFSANTRMSGVNRDGVVIRKGAVEAIIDHAHSLGIARIIPPDAGRIASDIARQGGTPLAVSRNGQILGIVHLKDIVKGGIRERFAELRKMGIRTVMITGDNAVTAAAIAAEAGVDFDSGNLRVDLVHHQVQLAAQEVKLSPKEYDILAQLVIHAGKVLTHRHLLREVWRDETIDPQYLRVYIRQLRQKIEADPADPRHLLTESGVGYRLV